ncbi:MAG: hydantoinase B/oxoprolinase family protein [Pseudomonadota bacterium]
MSMSATVRRDIFQRRVAGVAEEMSASLRRSAFSSIIWEMYDYSCALFTPDGQMIAQAETIAAQLGIMESACRRIAEEIPIDTWHSGDVIVCNDPYRGCTHTPDVVMFTPVIADGHLVALASTIAHHVDIGGKSPCTTVPDNTEVFGEGLILPPMKIVKAGEEVAEVFAILAANVRLPAASLGDLRAQVAGCRTGERRIAELVGRYGREAFAALCDEVLEYGETYMRASIAALGQGTSEAEVLIEDGVASDEPLAIRCRVEANDSVITVDFTGTSAQRANGLNCPVASTASMVSYAVKAVLAPDVTQNGGCARPIRVINPEGSVLNPRRPAAVGSRHYAQQAVGEVVLKALNALSPELHFSGSQIAFPALKAGGFDERPEMRQGRNDLPYFAITDILGGGGGATNQGDGMSGIDTHGGNCEILSAEVMELVCPVRVLKTQLVPDSGGDGQFRGGLAIRRDYELLSSQVHVNAYVQQTEQRTRPWGNAGGEPGARARVVLNPDRPGEQELPCKAIGVKLGRGDVVRLQSSGGGGWGKASDRDNDLIERDLKLGYTST